MIDVIATWTAVAACLVVAAWLAAPYVAGAALLIW